jgi:hypothetical protein
MADPKKALSAMQTALDALTPLDADERQRAMTWLGQTLEVEIPGKSSKSNEVPRQDGGGGGDGKASGPPAEDPKQFMAEKAPSTDVERMACLAYFLTKVRKVPKFKTADLTALNTEAAGHRFSNAARTTNNAVNQNGYLAQAGGGMRQITALGEKVAEALPNRDAVAEVLSNAPRRRRRSTARKAKTSK